MAGCATFNRASRVDVRPLQASVERGLGIHLQRVPPPPGQPGIPALRATLAGGDDRERVTILEFFETEGVAQALGAASSDDDTAVLRRANVAVLYSRTGGADHGALLERALHAAPLVTGRPAA